MCGWTSAGFSPGSERFLVFCLIRVRFFHPSIPGERSVLSPHSVRLRSGHHSDINIMKEL